MALSKTTMKDLIRLKKWVAIIRLMHEGEVDMPLKFKYENFLSFKTVCLRESKSPKSEYRYIPHYFGGNVLIIKVRKDGESTEQRMQAE